MMQKCKRETGFDVAKSARIGHSGSMNISNDIPKSGAEQRSTEDVTSRQTSIAESIREFSGRGNDVYAKA